MTTTDTMPLNLAEWIRALRAHLDMTQRQFAAALSEWTDPASVSYWESGRNRPNNAGRAYLAALAERVGYDQPMPRR